MIYALPAEARNHPTFPRRRRTAERIILLDGSGSIFFDVLSCLAEQKVSLIRIDWKGNIVCVAGASGYSSNRFRVKWQWETREDPERRRILQVANHSENRGEHYHPRKIFSPLR
jgi:hypothetical protein